MDRLVSRNNSSVPAPGKNGRSGARDDAQHPRAIAEQELPTALTHAPRSLIGGTERQATRTARAGPIENAIDRYGGDYRQFEILSEPKAEVCKLACEGENRCRAWTYVRPGYLGTTARCYLKDKIKRPRRSPCCISGVVR